MRSFTEATPEDVRALDRLAFELRSDKRRQAQARGVPIIDAFSLVFAETATHAGCR